MLFSDYLKRWPTTSNALPGTYRTQWISLITLLGNQKLDLLAIAAAQICLRMGAFLWDLYLWKLKFIVLDLEKWKLLYC